jgi:hypothetical protein
MAEHVGSLSKAKLDKLPQTASVDWMPYAINFDGQVERALYFHPVEKEGNKLEAEFRGRRLEGSRHPMSSPSGPLGVVLRSPVGQHSMWTIESRIDSLITWEWDSTDRNAGLNNAQEWIEIARVLHASNCSH